MRMRALLLAAAAAFVAVASATALADDGARLFRQISSPPGIVGSPEPEGEHAFVGMMDFYVPAQTAAGELTTIYYCTADDGVNCDNAEITSEIAKPEFGFYIYGPTTTFEDPATSGFPGHGRRDAFVAMSLDDGQTWKRVNLSNSADKSSFTTATTIQDPGVPAPSFEVTAASPVVTSAFWSTGQNLLNVFGGSATPGTRVDIRNAVTKDILATVRVRSNGTFSARISLDAAAVPCSIQAGYSADNVWGPWVLVANAPEECVGDTEVTLINEYPGDVTNGAFFVSATAAGALSSNYAFAAWQSKYCQAGFPAWSAEYPVDDVATYLGISNDVDLYLVDLFVVGGSQGSTDYREQEEYPGEYDDIGEVPYSCLWTARGIVREDPENLGTTEIVWTQAERLTSGRRDVNRIEVGCVTNAGCAVTWQEDPEGLRPGEGEGPGTGWSGATTASQTDVWYSFIAWKDFDIIDLNGEPVPLADNILDTGRPKPYVPMMVAARLTNNARCNVPVTGLEETYCNDGVAAAYQIPDQCIDQVSIPLGPLGELVPVCVADTNRDEVGDTGDTPNVANTASSRPRLSLQPRDSDGDGVTDDAWVISFSEEDKGLGRFGFLNDQEWNYSLDDTADYCGDPDVDLGDNCIEADIGKNIKWQSFAMGTPQTSVLDGVAASDKDFSLVNNLVVQGAQLNQPENNWRTGTPFPPMDTADMWDFGDTYNYLIFNNEIARRSSLMVQSVAKATTEPATSGLVAFPLYKQGIIRQGGPADIMARRFVVDAQINQADENPYDFANMKCEYTDEDGVLHDGTMFFTDGENPLYPEGLCMASAINLSGRTPFLCDTGGNSQADGICSTLTLECEEVEGYGQLCLQPDEDESPENIQVFDKLLSWYECPGWDGEDVSNGGNTGASTIPGACGTEDASVILGSNLNDQSWFLSTEISKAHRGFLDGDFVMVMHAWSPNFKENAVGRDRYELYARRSFDGGVTWTVTPSSYTGTDGVVVSGEGTTTCETWRDGDTSQTDSHICTEYEAGDPEQSRNMSQLKSMAFTILDPRFTPTRGTMVDQDLGEYASDIFTFEPQDLGGLLPTDVRSASRYFIVYEDGDNTTTDVGEAEPLDLGYGRAEVYGDVYTVWTEIDTGFSTIDDCYPNNTYGDTSVLWAEGTGFCNEFDGLEERKDDRSEEASITSSAYGDFFYSVWAQYTVDENDEFTEGDAVFRRIWYLDEYIPECDGCAYDVVGQGQE